MTTYAPDGSPVEAFAVLPAGPAPALIDGVLRPASTVLDLGCGAGRLAHRLTEQGHRVTGVDQCEEMLRHVDRGVDHLRADIEGLDLGRRFDAVILASFLVNTTDPRQRDEFVATCARHVEPDGVVLLQRLDPELVPIAVDAESEGDGAMYAMTDVRHLGTRFEATMVFTVGAGRWEHRYAGEVLDDGPMGEVLAAHGLRVTGYLDAQRTWVEARPA